MNSFSLLIIDDNEDDRFAYQRQLRAVLGDNVLIAEASGGWEGINLARRYPFDCALLDYSMPGMDGLTALKILQAENPEMPVVMLTGEGSERIAVNAMKGGVQDYALKSEVLAEKSLANLIMSAIERKREENSIFRRANYDSLTQLALRDPLMAFLDDAIGRAEDQEKSVGVVFIDLDDFKPVNDKYGHAIGDLLLQNAARRLLSSIRCVDMAGRLGGDEFAIILGELEPGSVQDAIRICNRIIDELAYKSFNVEGKEIRISLSLGVAMYPQCVDKVRLVQLADKAMYEAKVSGRHFIKVAGGEFYRTKFGTAPRVSAAMA